MLQALGKRRRVYTWRMIKAKIDINVTREFQRRRAWFVNLWGVITIYYIFNQLGLTPGLTLGKKTSLSDTRTEGRVREIWHLLLNIHLCLLYWCRWEERRADNQPCAESGFLWYSWKGYFHLIEAQWSLKCVPFYFCLLVSFWREI